MKVLYEDNHIIVINKAAGEIVQGDKTGDASLCDTMKQYLKEKYAKPGNVFIGLPHRLDRPVSGIVVFAKTSKALERLNRMFSEGAVKKIYWALTKGIPTPAEADIESWILRNEKMNKSFSYPKEVKGAKRALLHYRLAAASQNYNLIEVELKTGRHHQIRCQLSSIGCPIKGDLKYGAQRSNPDGSISLHARYIEFTHPVSKETIAITAPLPSDKLWQSFEG
ncbi:MAG: RNA pseudouridine synthase [Bacteroidaceae bacterium]|jgi:23S rRNA pseudouridine1911/1915/1917 synthase|nr:RNA pseudouridine synthase [Bacteroidaceae bacterium]